VQAQITDAASSGVDVVSVEQAHQIALDACLTRKQADELASDYGDALLDALKRSLFAVAIVAMGGLWFTRRLPAEPASDDDEVLAAAPEPA
jgi:hypothetical protein